MGVVTSLRAEQETSERSTAKRSVISLRGVEKHFPVKEGTLQRVVGQVRAVDGVSFEVRPGETVGLVGESGCGKTTLGRCISGLTQVTGGKIYFRLSDEDAAQARRDRRHPRARAHPRAAQGAGANRRRPPDRPALGQSLARHTAETARSCSRIRSALSIPDSSSRTSLGAHSSVWNEASGEELTERVVSLLESVGLGRGHLYRYPHQFSGGQRQRISIARALALDPEFIVLDEPTSSSTCRCRRRSSISSTSLQQERGLTYLFISHNLGVVRLMSDRIAVMYLGKVAEQGTAKELFEDPRHPYTEALLAANPDIASEESGDEGPEGDSARSGQPARRAADSTPDARWPPRHAGGRSTTQLPGCKPTRRCSPVSADVERRRISTPPWCSRTRSCGIRRGPRHSVGGRPTCDEGGTGEDVYRGQEE